METNVIVREAMPDDAEALIAYLQALTSEAGIDIPLAPGEFDMSVADEREYLERCHSSENSIVLVADAGGQIVGELNCRGGQRKALRHTATLGMSVRNGWRDRGIGSLLMERAVAWARRTECLTRIELYVYARNQRAIHLYEKFGFAVEGRRRRAIYQDGEYLDDLIMALLL